MSWGFYFGVFLDWFVYLVILLIWAVVWFTDICLLLVG